MAEDSVGVPRVEVSLLWMGSKNISKLRNRIYRLWDKPVGPHYLAMFEVNLFTPAQFGAFIPWLVINRGPLSALVHPNHEDDDAIRDHSQRATWLGERVPVDLGMLKKFMSMRKAKAETNGGT